MLNLFCCPQVAKKYKSQKLCSAGFKRYSSHQSFTISCSNPFANILSFQRLNTSKEKGGNQTNKSQPWSTSSSSHVDVRGRGEGCPAPTWTQEGRIPLAAPGRVSLSSDTHSSAAAHLHDRESMSQQSLWPDSLRPIEIYLHKDVVDITFSHLSFHLLRFSDVRDSWGTGAGKVSLPALLWSCKTLHSGLCLHPFWLQRIHLESTSGSALLSLWWNHACW